MLLALKRHRLKAMIASLLSQRLPGAGTRAFMITLSALTISCVPLRNSSNLLVTGGTPNDTSFPATIHLRFDNGTSCTGNFIRDDLLITTAHCVLNAKSAVLQGGGLTQPVQATEFESHPDFKIGSDRVVAAENVWKDVGFIHVPRRTASAAMIATFSATSARVGDTLTLVGYGENKAPGAGDSKMDNIKRTGTNKVAEVRTQNNSMFIIRANPNERSATNPLSLPAPGDSGGAVYNARGEIVGIASAATDDMAFIVNIVAPQSSAYIKKIMNEDAPTQTPSSLRPASSSSPGRTELLADRETDHPLASELPLCQQAGLNGTTFSLSYTFVSDHQGLMKLKTGSGFSCRISSTDDRYPTCASACPDADNPIRLSWGFCQGVTSFSCRL